MKAIIEVSNTILEILFPRICAACGKFEDFICSDCLERLNKYPVICHVCKRDLKPNLLVHPHCLGKTNLKGVFVLYEYDFQMKKIISEIKYKNHFSIISSFTPGLSSIFDSSNWQKRFKVKNTVFVPVPLDFFRKSERGFNQSEVICQQVEKKFGYKYENVLKRKVSFSHQVGLDKKERINNLKNIFEVISSLDSEYKNIVILDDVMTSGATLEECARALAKLFPDKRIFGLVISRG